MYNEHERYCATCEKWLDSITAGSHSHTHGIGVEPSPAKPEPRLYPTKEELDAVVNFEDELRKAKDEPPSEQEAVALSPDSVIPDDMREQIFGKPAKPEGIRLPLRKFGVDCPEYNSNKCSCSCAECINKTDELEANRQLAEIRVEDMAEIERLKAKDSEWYDYTKKLIEEHKQAIKSIFEELKHMAHPHKCDPDEDYSPSYILFWADIEACFSRHLKKE